MLLIPMTQATSHCTLNHVNFTYLPFFSMHVQHGKIGNWPGMRLCIQKIGSTSGNNFYVHTQNGSNVNCFTPTHLTKVIST